MTLRNSDHLVGHIIPILRQGVNWTVARSLGSDHALIFAYIIENTNGEGKAPLDDIEKYMNATRITVNRAITDLETEGLIKREEGKPMLAWINAHGCYDWLRANQKDGKNQAA